MITHRRSAGWEIHPINLCLYALQRHTGLSTMQAPMSDCQHTERPSVLIRPAR